MLTEQTKQAIKNLQKRYPTKRSALIPSLHLAQAQIGYLPIEAQEEVALLFEINVNEVHAVVSFYDMFFEKPGGKHVIHVCKNVPCMLRGADSILEKMCLQLKIQPGDTTEDGEITVIASECLAACDRAPMMLLDEEVIGPVDEKDLPSILSRLQLKKGHPSPVSLEVSDE